MTRSFWLLLLPCMLLTIAVAAAQQRASSTSPAPTPAYADLPTLMKSLPNPDIKPLNLDAALLLSAVPLSCVDELQPKPAARPYFWQPSYKIVEAHDKNRAFYGCTDWSTAVNSMWTMVILLKRYPDLPDRELIREKLTDHLGRQNLEGELAYFKASPNFQRPYGYAWFLKLYAELATWRDPDGARYAEDATPLARYLADSLVSFLVDVEHPNRSATQTNSAFVIGLLLDYVDVTRDMTIGRAASETAKRIFLNDKDCATDTEAVQPELNSPCLEEAAVMSRVVDRAAFLSWFDKFMPPAYAAKFNRLRTVNLDAIGRGRGGRGAKGTPDAAATPATTSRSTWTGLAFTRAVAYERLASALPATDERVAVFRKLAAIHAGIGQQGLAEPGAADAPWLNTLALSYLMTLGGAH